ncbi:MAG: uracil-DNA glycosylase family protein, partial [Chloroflexota bacterium]
VSPGDKLFRAMLVKYGFKDGTVTSPGGWRCYITDVIKSVDRAEQWNKRPVAHHRAMAETWASVLAWELELGRPKIVVSVGAKVDRLLNFLLQRRLVPPLGERMRIAHYSYIGSRADAKRRLGPGNPIRLAEWEQEFAAIAQARVSVETAARGVAG